MINPPKVCIYTIALNEEKHVERFMNASKDADLVIVCDTGSIDQTVPLLERYGATVYNIKQKPWRFDVPRNTALSLVPKDFDLCLSIDLDEYLQPGWREAVNEAWQKSEGKLTRITYDYIWNWKEDGVTPDIRFFTDKFHHRNGYIWRHPCHETLYWEGKGPEIKEVVPEVILHHRADPTKSRGQYLHLLKMAVEEAPENDRMCHYYARELMYNNRWIEAITEFERHLALPTARWNEERCASLRFMSKCYRSMGNLQTSVDAAMKGLLECNNTREPWVEVARAAYALSDWRTCYWAASKAIDITERSMSYIYDSASWGWEPYDLAALGAYYTGHYKEALRYGEEAVKLFPNEERLKKNLDFYKDKNL